MAHAAGAGAKSGVDFLKTQRTNSDANCLQISSNHLSHERMIGFNLVCRTLVHTALGFQPFPAKPMYRFGAWIALVICQLPCTALRTIQNNLDQACPVEAAPTHGDAQCLTVSANSKMCFEMGFTEREPECVPTRFVDIVHFFTGDDIIQYVPGMSPGAEATEVYFNQKVCRSDLCHAHICRGIDVTNEFFGSVFPYVFAQQSNERVRVN